MAPGLAEVLPERLLSLPMSQVNDLLCRAHPGVWAERVRAFQNAPLHWEWYDWMLKAPRLAVVAPRDHAKTEVFTVNQTAWRSIYQPGTWTYVFAQTGDQAQKIKERIDAAIESVRPSMLERARVKTLKESQYENYSAVTVAGAGKAVRGGHPDVIVGDDVLDESTSSTAYQRKRTEEWWRGTVSGMAHPGTVRSFGKGLKVKMPPTRVVLVGTPFHRSDLLMSMKKNPLYVYRRYAAEFQPEDLVDGLAVEVG